MKLPAGIKARYPDHWKDYENEWPKHMRGREITVYILLFESTKTTKQTMLYSRKNLSQGKKLIDWTLSSNEEIYALHDLSKSDEIPLERYLDFTVQAEALLQQHGIQPNGCAIGDYPIGHYTSLRNEKFVAVEDDEDDRIEKVKLLYPPNACGFNGSCDPRDLSREIVSLDTYRTQKRRQQLLNFAIPLIVVFCLILFISS